MNIQITGVDTSNFDRAMADLVYAFKNNGAGSVLGDFVQQQAGALANEIATRIGPRLKSRQEAAMKEKVHVFIDYIGGAGGAYMLSGKQRGGQNGVAWLRAGPTFLEGAFTEMDRTLDAAYAYNTFLDGRRHGFSKKAIKGRHGKQGVRIHQKPVFMRWAFNQAVGALVRRGGRAKASFVATAQRLIPLKRYPAWVTDRIPEVESEGKTSVEIRLDGDNPQVTFSSSVPGVQSNPRFLGIFQAALDGRARVMATTLRKMMGGFHYNVATGQVFKPKVKDESA